jgi:hypothetical protein
MFPYLRVGIFKLWKDLHYTYNDSMCRCTYVERASDQALITILIIDFKIYDHNEIFPIASKLMAILLPYIIIRFLCFVQLVSFACHVIVCNNNTKT